MTRDEFIENLHVCMNQDEVTNWLNTGFSLVEERFKAEGFGQPYGDLPRWAEMYDKKYGQAWAIQRILTNDQAGLFRLKVEITFVWTGPAVAVAQILGGEEFQEVIATQGLCQFQGSLPECSVEEAPAAALNFVRQAPAMVTNETLDKLFHKVYQKLAY